MIDAYLAGQLSPEETSRLMESLEKDPALKEEFLLQQSTVKALQEYRRMALKARLDTIEVGTGFSFTSAVGLKFIAGTALVALLGTAAYFGYSEFTEPAPLENAILLTEEDTDTTTPLSLERLPVKPEVAEENKNKIAKKTIAAKEVEKEVEPVIAPETHIKASKEAHAKKVEIVEKEKSVVASAEKENASTSTSKASSAEVIKPDVLTDFEETDITARTPEVEVPEDQLANRHSFDNSTISVSTKSDSRYNFHYRFYDNQLQIFGDFKSVPYEVLEVNTGLSTRYFLYHKDQYFELKPNQQKITRLQELTDKKTIKELEITRTEKLNK